MRTTLITGCSSGIGRATALSFLQAEWRVYATARDPDDVEDLAEAGCETAALDVTDGDQVEAVVERVVDEAGRIDCLVNNAGYAQYGPLEDIPVEKARRQYDVNVHGSHRLTRATLPHMREREDGTIVNVSSVAGRVAHPGGSAYCGSKFALEAMSDALRSEVAEFGIDVVVVEPGPVATAFRDRAKREMEGLERSGAYDAVYRLFEDAWAVSGDGPLASQSEDAAETILHAASCTDPAARYPVGRVASGALLARFVPDRWRDALYGAVRRLLG